MTDNNAREAHIVVGVVPNQPDAVVIEAATLASLFGAELVCAWVDVSSFAVDELPDGSVRSFPYDPDAIDTRTAEFDPGLKARIGTLLDERGVTWSTRVLAGDPARALGHLADRLDAAMIVVGTREATVRATVQEFFGGSVAVHLAHRQHRPVVVIPLSPVSPDQALPWERN